jgi:integrase
MLDVFLYTGLRRGDAARLGRQHVRNGVIEIDTEKTGMRVTIPILPVLQASLKAGPVGELAFKWPALYTRAANRRKLAEDAVGKLARK